MIKVTTVFPWTLVPTIIEVNDEKVQITFRELFWTSQQVTLGLEEVHSVEVDSGIFFSSINIVYGYEDEKIRIPYLYKRDAQKIKMAIEQGKYSKEGKQK